MSDEERNNLIINNLGLIYLVIKKMKLSWNTDDEFQNYYDYGLDGLIKASKNYDTNQDTKFSSFACVCIKNNIARHLYLKTMPKRFNPNGTDISLNYIVNEDYKNKTEYGDFIADPNVNIEKEIEKKLEIEKLINAINNLKNEKDKISIKMYYGIEGFREHTLEEVANKLGVTKEMIRVRVSRARKKLKEYLENNDRDVFLIKYNEEVIMKKEQKKDNTLQSLNDYLFEQLSNLNNNQKDLNTEIRKSYAVTQLAQQIINNANTCIKAAKLVNENEIKDKKTLSLIGINNE